jgi:hypothetical protein
MHVGLTVGRPDRSRAAMRWRVLVEGPVGPVLVGERDVADLPGRPLGISTMSASVRGIRAVRASTHEVRAEILRLDLLW